MKHIKPLVALCVLLPMAVSGFIRLATHAKVFRKPAPSHAAIAFIDSLLAVPGVVDIYCTGGFITITRDPGTPWSAIEPGVTELIEGHKARRVIGIANPAGPGGAAGATSGAAEATGEEAVEVEADDAELLMRINQILDEHLRPFLDQDGGGLDVVKLKEFTLTVRYKGACGGCPSSSTGTLFAINNLLQSYVDDRLLVEPIY